MLKAKRRFDVNSDQKKERKFDGCLRGYCLFAAVIGKDEQLWNRVARKWHFKAKW